MAQQKDSTPLVSSVLLHSALNLYIRLCYALGTIYNLYYQ
jgi:hypothetical protein